MFTTCEQVIEKVYRPAEAIKIALCVPSLGLVSVPWHSRMKHLQLPMNVSWIEAYVIGKPVDEARNALVASVLDQGATHVFFVDDDVLLPQDALVRLFQHKKDIVSGVYFLKSDPPQPLILKGVCGGLFTDWSVGDVIECDGHGMGCALIARKVFDAMAPHVGKDANGAPSWFQTRREEKAGDSGLATLSMTEDTDFCCKARSLGFQPTVDTGVYCWHWCKDRLTAFPTQAWDREVNSLTKQIAS